MHCNVFTLCQYKIHCSIPTFVVFCIQQSESSARYSFKIITGESENENLMHINSIPDATGEK